jgi:hypothetical protein
VEDASGQRQRVENLTPELLRHLEMSETLIVEGPCYHDFGFMFGCYWACPYEIMLLDFRRLADGLVVLHDELDRADLRDYVPLKGAVTLGPAPGSVQIVGREGLQIRQLPKDMYQGV